MTHPKTRRDARAIRRDLTAAATRLKAVRAAGGVLGEQVMRRRIDDLLDQFSAALKKEAP